MSSDYDEHVSTAHLPAQRRRNITVLGLIELEAYQLANTWKPGIRRYSGMSGYGYCINIGESWQPGVARNVRLEQLPSFRVSKVGIIRRFGVRLVPR